MGLYLLGPITFKYVRDWSERLGQPWRRMGHNEAEPPLASQMALAYPRRKTLRVKEEGV